MEIKKFVHRYSLIKLIKLFIRKIYKFKNKL